MATSLFDLTGRSPSSPAAMAASGSAWRAGWRKPAPAIAIVGRNAAKSDAAVAELKQRGAKAISVIADVTDKAAVAAMVERVASELGRIDILVNNAGINIRKPPHALALEEWDSVIDDQPHQRVPVLAGGLPRDEGRRAAARSSISAR